MGIFLRVCLCTAVCLVPAGTRKRALNPLELALQMVVKSFHVGARNWFSGRAASAPNLSAVSPAPYSVFDRCYMYFLVNSQLELGFTMGEEKDTSLEAECSCFGIFLCIVCPALPLVNCVL